MLHAGQRDPDHVVRDSSVQRGEHGLQLTIRRLPSRLADTRGRLGVDPRRRIT